MLVEFQRFEEAGREPERNAIAVPHLAPLATGEAKPVGIGQLLSVEVGQEQLLGAFVVDMLARRDYAIARAMLERDAPSPTRIACGFHPRVTDGVAVGVHGTAIARSHGSQ